MTANQQFIVNAQQTDRSPPLLSDETEKLASFVQRDLHLGLGRKPAPDSCSLLTGGNLEEDQARMGGGQRDRDRAGPYIKIIYK